MVTPKHFGILLVWAAWAALLLPPAGAAPISAAPGVGQTLPLHWVFQMRRNTLGDPVTDVFLDIGSRKVLVLRHAQDQFQVSAQTEYKEQGIPATALTACAGWWGGAGDELYVIRRGRSLIVFRREEDEQAPTFPWKRLKVILLR